MQSNYRTRSSVLRSVGPTKLVDDTSSLSTVSVPPQKVAENSRIIRKRANLDLNTTNSENAAPKSPVDLPVESDEPVKRPNKIQRGTHVESKPKSALNDKKPITSLPRHDKTQTMQAVANQRAHRNRMASGRIPAVSAVKSHPLGTNSTANKPAFLSSTPRFPPTNNGSETPSASAIRNKPTSFSSGSHSPKIGTSSQPSLRRNSSSFSSKTATPKSASRTPSSSSHTQQPHQFTATTMPFSSKPKQVSSVVSPELTSKRLYTVPESDSERRLSDGNFKVPAAKQHPSNQGSVTLQNKPCSIKKTTSAPMSQSHATSAVNSSIPSRIPLSGRLQQIASKPSEVDKMDVDESLNGIERRDSGIDLESENTKRTLKRTASSQLYESFVPEQIDDLSLFADYEEDIFEDMRRQEIETQPNPSHLSQQPEVNAHHRARLVEWLTNVHSTINGHIDSLYLAVNLIDRVLSLRVVPLEGFQMIGTSALFIATKFTEKLVPTVLEFSYLTEYSCTPQDIIKAERMILQILQFKLSNPGPLSFLERLFKIDRNARKLSEEKQKMVEKIANYFCEASIVEHKFIGCVPSWLAAGAVYSARKIVDNTSVWTPEHVRISQYNEDQCIQCGNVFLNCAANFGLQHATFSKYASESNLKASIRVQEFLKEVNFHAAD
ncbi:hypothetical protein HK098_000355 [Nowakowskiella sp. JEL0407]|nr:hypothetical protein HK098_000355 [Nowakowskiella sp. JEL0407]